MSNHFETEEEPIIGKTLMTFFRSYFDESGKFKDHRVISFCGVLASSENVRHFNGEWDALLRKNNLTCLHTVHALQNWRNLSTTIRKGSPKDRCESLKPFIDCIVQNLELGIVLAIDVQGYSKWSPGAKKRVGGDDDPAYLSFLQAMQAFKLYANRDDDRISVMCDDDQDTALNFYQLYRHIKKIDEELRKKLVTLSFSDDTAYPALQAADLVAALTRLEALRVFKYHTHNFGALTRYMMQPDRAQRLKWCGFIGDEISMGEIGGRLGSL